jgi:membrane-bound lytic murein transglycosylase D
MPLAAQDVSPPPAASTDSFVAALEAAKLPPRERSAKPLRRKFPATPWTTPAPGTTPIDEPLAGEDEPSVGTAAATSPPPGATADESWPQVIVPEASSAAIGAGALARATAVLNGTATMTGAATAAGASLNGAAADDDAAASSGIKRFANVWLRIRAGFALPTIDDALVRKWESFYAGRADYWQRITERSKRYLYYITREIERRGMPLEIALLPVIESAYNPEALSRARALGIWQFIPATGKLYGLQQNWWLDNRRDVSVATMSALDYLEKLHVLFGDWQLALAAYNWGEGAVQRAIARNRARHLPTDYASLKIPGETRNYLPKLQAVKNIILDPDRFGLPLPDVPDAPYFVTVTTDRQIDIALAAKLADMPLDEFKSLNPQHNRPVIASDGEQRINLPYDKAETFVMNLDSYRQPLLSWRPYQVKIGEGLDKIAPQFGIDLDELKRVNGLTGRKRITPGFTLLVPAKSGFAPDALPTAAFKEAPADLPAWHKVRRGETLQQIADRYGLTLGELKRVNALSRNAVPAGRRLRLTEGAPSAGSKATKGVKATKVSKERKVVKETKVVKPTKKRAVKPVRKR